MNKHKITEDIDRKLNRTRLDEDDIHMTTENEEAFVDWENMYPFAKEYVVMST